MLYWLIRWRMNLRKKLWRPYEDYASDEVVAYVRQFDQPLEGWEGGFVPGTAAEFNDGGVYTEFYVAPGWGNERRVKYVPPEMLRADSDDIIAREAYEKMRTSKIWRWRWRTFGRQSDDKADRRQVAEALEASFAKIPPLK